MNSLVTLSFRSRPSHARLKKILVWSAIRFSAETEVECSGMVPAMDGAPAWMGTPMEGRERASSSPNSREGSEHWLQSKDNRAGAGSEDNLGGATKGVECNMGGGGRGRCLGLCDLLQLCSGLALAPHLCFALRSSEVPSQPTRTCSRFVLLCTRRHGLCVVEISCGAVLNHARCFHFWTCHVPYRDSYSESLSLDL